jgi:hypothetical protein
MSTKQIIRALKELKRPLHDAVTTDDAYGKPQLSTPLFQELFSADTCIQGAIEALKRYEKIWAAIERATQSPPVAA